MSKLVTGLVWVGTRTERFAEMRDFLRERLGATLSGEERDFAVFRLPDGSKAEIFGPSDTDHEHFSTGPVVGFQVDDVRTARAELEEAGVEFIGPVHVWEPTGEAWSHFRAPDGNVYEITDMKPSS
jgi:catechol 2,3-dioxygenase-like lactoylglutathione lyase family enzyme